MSRFSRSQLRQIGELLHDATLRGANWNRALRAVTLRFDCLRGNADGTGMDDRTVEFRLIGVAAIAIGYDGTSIETRPSQVEPPRRITEVELSEWPFRAQEATLRINSARVDDALDAARLDWLVGDEARLRACPRTFCLQFGQWMDFGAPAIGVWLLAGGDDFTITAGGVPLALDEWSRQHEAWWKGWQAHWDAKRDTQDDEPGTYDAAIPAGEPEPVDLSYRPPAEPVFEIDRTDAPPELVVAVRDWFESHHERDWVRLARAYPSPDVTLAEQARQLEIRAAGCEFGRWGYARGIDLWWQEGRRGCLVVRGIEHEMPVENDPAGNRESVWSFALRRRDGGWIIDTYSQGWPGFGSAPKLERARKPWLSRWRSGKVRT